MNKAKNEEKQFYKDKIPKCKLYKNKRFWVNITKDENEDKGMTMDEFNKDRCITKMLKNENDKDDYDKEEEIDKKEFERLTNDKNGMFKKWSNPTNQ